MACFAQALIYYPVAIAAFHNPYSMGEEDISMLAELDDRLSSIARNEVSTPSSMLTGDWTSRWTKLASIQASNPASYGIAVNLVGRRPPVSVFDVTPALGQLVQPDLDSFSRLVNEIHRIELRQDVLEEDQFFDIEKILKIFRRFRRRLNPPDWEFLQRCAVTPMALLFARFLEESRSLSPELWRSYCKRQRLKPQNPVVDLNMVEVRWNDGVHAFIPAAGMWEISPGVFVTVDDSLAINILMAGALKMVASGELVMIGGREVRLNARGIRVRVEIPLTVWPEYKASRTEKMGEAPHFVIVRDQEGSYAIRAGAQYFHEMMRPEDIFVAAGPAVGPALMKDPFFGERALLVSRIINPQHPQL